jgi:hypothetical protein
MPEAQEWLSLLLLHVGNRDDPESESFRFHLDIFTGHPQQQNTGQLLEGVLKLALKENTLFPDNTRPSDDSTPRT